MRTALLLFAIGCNSSTPAPPTIKATDFDQTCTQASDCILIDEGSACCTGCGNAAINKNDQSKYQAAAQMRRDACKNTACPAIDCAAREVTCTAGKCALCPTPSCSAKDASSD